MPVDAPNMPGPGAGTPGGDDDASPVAAGANPGAPPQPGAGVLPPNGAAVPQSVPALGKQGPAIDTVRACLKALKNVVFDIQDNRISHPVYQFIEALQKVMPTPGPNDEKTNANRDISAAILARRAGGQMGQGGPPPMPGGRPPGAPQLPGGMPGAPPGMTPPPVG